jgi:hypothetical protein
VVWRNCCSRPPYRHVRIFFLELSIFLRGIRYYVHGRRCCRRGHSRTHWETIGAISSLCPSGSLSAPGMAAASLLKHFSNCELGISKISTSRMRSPCSSAGTMSRAPHVSSVWRQERVATSRHSASPSSVFWLCSEAADSCDVVTQNRYFTILEIRASACATLLSAIHKNQIFSGGQRREHRHLAYIAPGAGWCVKCDAPNWPPLVDSFRGPLCVCFSVNELQTYHQLATTTRGCQEMMVGQCWGAIERLDKVHVFGRSYLKPHVGYFVDSASETTVRLRTHPSRRDLSEVKLARSGPIGP